ncbi:hypothetical protein CES86_1532 [Brucella lupini]|uniref:Uncharacterized protein n=1 Tax=Brucella lupini TaxID=255457 RepID=A0A256GV43_9HYPH|nr:hypothetical protein CES86_1532 [Brucella lupini]
MHEIENEPDDDRQRDEEAEPAPDPRSPKLDGIIFGGVSGSQMMRSAGKSAPHDAFGTGLLAFESVENTPGLFLTLASWPAAFPYARLLALAHALPALCNDLVRWI